MTVLLLFLGSLLVVIGFLMLLVAAFRVSIWWGLASLLIPFVQLIFVFIHWSESKSAIFTQTIGLLLILAALLVGGQAFTDQYKQQLKGYMQQAAPDQMQQLNELQSMVSEPTASAIPKPVVSKATVADSVGVTPAPAADIKTIYKCMDARGKIAYTDQPCVNGKEKKIITIQSDIDPSPSDKVGDVIERVKEMISFDKKEAKPDPEPAN